MPCSNNIYRTAAYRILTSEEETGSIGLMMNPGFLPQSGRHVSVFIRDKFQPIYVAELIGTDG